MCKCIPVQCSFGLFQHLCRSSGEDPSPLWAVHERGSGPFRIGSLPCVPVVSPPTIRGAHDWAQARRRIRAVFSLAWVAGRHGHPVSRSVPGAFPGAILEG